MRQFDQSLFINMGLLYPVRMLFVLLYLHFIIVSILNWSFVVEFISSWNP